MKELLKKYLSLSFENKTIANTLFSIIFNCVMGIGKIVIGIFSSVFFIASGLVNVFLMFAKVQVYFGVRYPYKKSFEYRNRSMGIYLILAAVQYIVFMLRPLIFNVELTKYNMILGIAIAFVSFVELGVSIMGCFQAFGKGHYYRNIKLINLCSAFTAIVLTENAILSFTSESDTTFASSIFGAGVGLVNVLIGIYILLAPRISTVDRKHNVYRLNGSGFSENEINITLTNSKFYGNYFYVGKVVDDVVDGVIVKGKSPIIKWNIYIKILIVVLSEILIFPYAFGALIFHFKSSKIISKLDNEMLKLNCVKIKEVED